MHDSSQTCGHIKPNSIKFFLFITLLEGILALIFLLIPPSMEKNALFFGYSLSRIALGSFILLLLFFTGFITAKSCIQTRWLNDQCEKLNQRLSENHNLLIIFVVLCFLFIFILTIILFFQSSLAGHLGILVSIYHRSISIIFWIFLIIIQLLVTLWLSCSKIYGQQGFINFKIIYQVSIILFILFITIFHWLVLSFQLGIFGALPYWFWQWTQKDITPWYGIFFILLVLSIFCIRYIFNNPEKTVRNLMLLVVLGYLLQVGFGFFAGNGFESIRDRFVRSGHKQYALHACDQPELYTAITNYEEMYSQDMFLGTKPPGIIAFYIITQRISNSILPETDYEGCFYRLTMFKAVLFPLLSLLILIPLYFFSKSFIGKINAFLPCIIYIVFPNIILMHLELDQVLFPLLFLCGVNLIFLTIKRQSFIYSIVCGAYIYFAAFFTFALIPLLALAFAWILIDYWMNRKTRKISSMLKFFTGIGLGIIVIAAILYILLNYDIFLRYGNSIIRHRMHKLYEPGLQQIFEAILLNNVEFSVWSGIPIILLAIATTIKSAILFFKRKADQFDYLLAAFALTYIALNIMGQTRGEVGRLWIFLLPVIALFAAKEVKELFNNKIAGISFIYILQLITTLLTYHFQDSIFM